MEQFEVRSALMEAIEKDCFFKTLDEFEFKKIHAKESVIAKELAYLHNEAIFDLNKQFLQLTKKDDQYSFYRLIYAYCSTLTKLSSPVTDIVNVFIHFKSQEFPLADFEQEYFLFCKQNIERPKVALSYLLGKPEERHELVQSTLMAAVELDSKWVMEQLSVLIQHQSADIRWQAYLAIGRVPIEDGCSLEKRFDLLDKASTSEINPKANSGIIRAAGLLAKQRPSLWNGINQVLEKCLKAKESETIHEAAYLLGYDCKNAPDSTIDLLTSYSKFVSPQNKGTLNLLTIFISNSIKTEKYDVAEDLLGTLLLKNDELRIGDFEHLAHELASERSSVFLNRITTKWLLSGEAPLCVALLSIVGSSHLNNPELVIDKVVLPLSDNELFFIARKAVGWFYYYPISGMSYLLSIIPYVSSDVGSRIGQLIYEPMLLSYTGKGKNYLVEKLNSLDDDSQVIVKQLLLDLDSYRLTIKEAFEIKELRAPEREVDLYRKDSNTKISQSMEKAKKGSVIDLIATTQTILYGNDTVLYASLGDEKQRIKNTMYPFSYSTELPKIDVIDPEGLNIMLRVFRNERLKNEIDS